MLMRLKKALVEKKPGLLPQFTSCCPGWIKFAEHYYPDMLSHSLELQIAAADVRQHSENLLCQQDRQKAGRHDCSFDNALHRQKV